MEIEFDRVSLVIDQGTPLEKIILSDVSFKISKPGIYSFVGASNSGKTAIGDLINALMTPTRGAVKIGEFINDGRRIRKINNLRFETGYVFKNPYDMFFCRTVKQEIEFGLKYFNYKVKKKEIRTIDALKLVGLDESYLDLNPQVLSLSDARKVAIACIIVYNPSIIILDEPTSGLSMRDKKELERIIYKLKTDYHKTILVLTKDTSFAYDISNKIYLMYLTKIVSVGGKSLLEDVALLDRYNLETPKIVSFTLACREKNHNIRFNTDIQDLVREVYQDVF